MTEAAKFIWLDKNLYPLLQESSINFFAEEKKKYKFGVAAFKKRYEFDKKIKNASIEIFGDTRYFIWQNGSFVGTGPCPPCGDFDMPYQYSSTYDCEIDKNYIDFLVRVQTPPVVQTDSSKGKGGLIMEACLTFEDGTKSIVYTDETWLARQEKEFMSPGYMDYTRKRDEWRNAVLTENVWNVLPAPIKNLSFETVSSEKFTVEPHSKKEFKVDLDKIYSAFSALDIKADGDYKIELITAEKGEISKKKHYIRGKKSESYRSNEYFSVGEYCLIAENMSDTPLEITSDVIFVCYPSEENGYFKCSDDMLNRIYDLGKWTVKICRQALELDSPVHQENLLCTGDYIVESLVNNFTTGDYSLTRFDVVRMGEYLHTTGGYIYGGNYAIMWVKWLYEYYIYSGDKSVFKETLGGLEELLKRHKAMEGENGLLVDISGYSFVDWAYIDGHSLFQPPRALGEAVTNAYYYNTIKTAARIYEILDMTEKAEYYGKKASNMLKAFNETFFDAEKGLYFDGLNDPSPCNDWIPENPEKRYYTRYSNTLAVLFDICDKDRQKDIMEWVLKEENLDGVQPYFMHFVFEAVQKTGLFEKYGMNLIRKWQVLVDDCEKGLHEVWRDFEGYGTDYSHGWGSTATYQLPSKLCGLEIIEPGFDKIKLEPRLCGLDWAEIKIPTPKGIISCNMKQGEKPELFVPEGIEVVL